MTNLELGLGSEDPFSIHTDLSDAISDYFGANQWCRTCVSENGNVPFFAHNFKRKSIGYSILSLQVASLSRATLCC